MVISTEGDMEFPRFHGTAIHGDAGDDLPRPGPPSFHPALVSEVRVSLTPQLARRTDNRARPPLNILHMSRGTLPCACNLVWKLIVVSKD
jgi:hypothetical protein